MRRRLAAFGRFWWEFVIGDDWRAAAAVVVGIGATASLAAGHIAAWWALPLTVAAVLYVTIRRAISAQAS